MESSNSFIEMVKMAEEEQINDMVKNDLMDKYQARIIEEANDILGFYGVNETYESRNCEKPESYLEFHNKPKPKSVLLYKNKKPTRVLTYKDHLERKLKEWISHGKQLY